VPPRRHLSWPAISLCRTRLRYADRSRRLSGRFLDWCVAGRHPRVAVRVAANMAKAWEGQVGGAHPRSIRRGELQDSAAAAIAAVSSVSAVVHTYGSRSCTACLLTDAFLPAVGDPCTAVIAFLVDGHGRQVLIDVGKQDMSNVCRIGVSCGQISCEPTLSRVPACRHLA
jgi:hypothetical protein